ncbi:hypothetical protein NFJ02_17g27590 [Pycnococcus provasolii]
MNSTRRFVCASSSSSSGTPTGDASGGSKSSGAGGSSSGGAISNEFDSWAQSTYDWSSSPFDESTAPQSAPASSTTENPAGAAAAPASTSRNNGWRASLAVGAVTVAAAVVGIRYLPVPAADLPTGGASDGAATTATNRARRKWCRSYEERRDKSALPSDAIDEVVARASEARQAVSIVAATKEEAEKLAKLEQSAKDAAASLESEARAKTAADTAKLEAAQARAEESLRQLLGALDVARADVASWVEAEASARRTTEDALYCIYRTEEALASMEPPSHVKAWITARRIARTVSDNAQRIRLGFDVGGSSNDVDSPGDDV